MRWTGGKRVTIVHNSDGPRTENLMAPLGQTTQIQKRRASILDVMSPMAFAAFMTVALLLTVIDNPIGWASTYTYFDGITPSIGATYVLAFSASLSIIGFLAKLRLKQRSRGSAYSRDLYINERLALYVFLIATAFQLAKFVNIGSIPLFGDPLSRYKLTLGGFEDYPSRLLAPLGSALFCLNVVKKRYRSTRRLMAIGVALLLNMLMTQRQEIANLVFGCCLIWAFNRRAKGTQLVVLALFAFLLAYVVVGLGSVLRFGANNISSSLSSLTLPMWVVHAEITVPYVFGEHVLHALHGNMLYGLYTFGEFISVFSPVKVLHGASLMQGLFTDKDTAQSVGAPYSYFIDFSYAGLIVVALINASIMSFYYRRATFNRGSTYWLTAYSIVLLSAFWSIRSGISLFYPLIIYILTGLFCVTGGGTKIVSQIRSIARFAFGVSLVVSIAALLFRR
jgi:oligosaccharide repeat unit polymerase